MVMKVKTGRMMQPQAKESRQPLEAGGSNRFSPQVFNGRLPCWHPGFSPVKLFVFLASGTVSVLSYPGCVTLLEQP